MRKQDYPIQLSKIERMELEDIVRKGQQKARVIRRAHRQDNRPSDES